MADETTDWRQLCGELLDVADRLYKQSVTQPHNQVLRLSNGLHPIPIGNDILVQDVCASFAIDRARAALAVEPAFAASEPSDEDLADLAEVFNGDPLPAMRRALELWGRPTIAALAAEPPTPAPAVDGEREELADDLGWIAAQLSDIGWGDDSASVARAATLLREPAPAPVPVPVAERPWERRGWCDVEGRCWWSACWADWKLRRPAEVFGGWLLPHWAIPIPQPPQGGDVGQ